MTTFDVFDSDIPATGYVRLFTSPRDQYVLDEDSVYKSMGYTIKPLKHNSKAPILPEIVDGCNFGLFTDGFSVIDLDMYKEGATKLLAGLTQSELAELARFPIQQTPRGGIHILGVLPYKVKSTLNWIDIKDNANSYIVCFPSVIDGRLYRWIQPLCSKSALQAYCVFPTWLLDKLKLLRKEVYDIDLDSDDYSAYNHSKEDIEKIGEWLTKQTPAIRGEGGDVQYFKVAVDVVIGLCCSERLATYLLMTFYNPVCPEPMPLAMVKHKVEAALQYRDPRYSAGYLLQAVLSPDKRETTEAFRQKAAVRYVLGCRSKNSQLNSEYIERLGAYLSFGFILTGEEVKKIIEGVYWDNNVTISAYHKWDRNITRNCELGFMLKDKYD